MVRLRDFLSGARVGLALVFALATGGATAGGSPPAAPVAAHGS